MFNRLISSINEERKPLSSDAEEALVKRFVDGDEAAGAELIETHLRLALILSLEYVKKGGSLEELFQEGVVGLHKALDRFKLNKGTRFASYATWWVRSQLQDFMRTNSRQIVLPSHVIDQISKLTKATTAFVAEHQREPNDNELAGLLKLSERKIGRLKVYVQPEVSLYSQPCAGEGASEVELHDSIEDIHQETACQCAMRLNDLEQLETAIAARLSEQEQGVLRYRFGLNGGSELTLEATGELMGVSIARVQQIERAAIDKLKKVMVRR